MINPLSSPTHCASKMPTPPLDHSPKSSTSSPDGLSSKPLNNPRVPPTSFPPIHESITFQNVFILLSILVLFEKTFHQYGNQVQTFLHHMPTTFLDHASFSLVHLWVLIPFVVLSFLLEKLQWSLWKRGNLAFYHTIKQFELMSIASVLSWLCVSMKSMERWTPLSFFVTIVSVSLSLKIYSYFSDNDSFRRAHPTGADIAGETCSFSRLIRFLICPTLIYRNSLKCTKRMKLSQVFYHFSLFFICASISVVVTVQWSIPIVSSLIRNSSPTPYTFLMAWLNLSIPITITWLVGFVGFFHHWCHMVAEITGLPEQERHFYLDWWNSSDIAGFWRRWNLPVHLFSVQYIYKPLRTSGYSKLAASMVVFLISAVLHELVFAVSLNIYHSPIGFIGMAGQIPLQILCRHKTLGEYLVGLMVVLGLSAGVIGYTLAMVLI